MGFHIKSFLFALAGVFLVWGDALAICTATKQDCADGYYNMRGCQVDSPLHPVGYECKPCPAPFDRSGNNGDTIAECYATKTCSVDEQCMIHYNGDTSCSDGVGAPGNNHLEIIDQNVECVGNDRNCKDFNVTSIDWGGEWNSSQNSVEYMVCDKNDQSGTARWQNNKWNISGCRCSHSGFIWHKKCDGKYVLVPRYPDSGLSGIGDEIEYFETPEQYYCNGCKIGTVPRYVCINDSTYQCYNMDNVQSGNVVCECKDVNAPYYATGCTITYPFDANVTSGCHDVSDNNISSGCQKSCPAGMETIENGATSIDACVPDVNQIYHDGTGTFTLGTERCRP